MTKFLKIIAVFFIGLFFLAMPVYLVFADVIFVDIQKSKYKESIEYLFEKGVVEGYKTATSFRVFRPKNPATRAELMKIVIEAFTAESIPNKNNCFKDVKTEWFSRYICYAKEKGIVKGYPDSTFKPWQNVNMAEAIKMAALTAGVEIPPSLQNEPWYKSYIEFTHQNNIFSKYSYLPGREILREEIAFLTHQLMLVKEGKRVFENRRDSRSSGCGKIPPKSAPTSSIVNGVTRNYITVIPKNYSKDAPIKLVFAFHGRTNSNEMVRGYYGVEEASSGKAIFIYPAGIRKSTGYTWANPGDPPSMLRDFALFDQLLKEFSEKYCIDTDNVYVVGHSLGAWFVNSLACARGDVIRAIGTVGGGTTIGKCTGPAGAMIMHNPKDNLVPFSQGEAAMEQLRRQNQCANRIKVVEPKTANCRLYLGCNEYAPLIWCPHNINTDWQGSYYPHTWPTFAGREIWKFFEGLKS